MCPTVSWVNVKGCRNVSLRRLASGQTDPRTRPRRPAVPARDLRSRQPGVLWAHRLLGHRPGVRSRPGGPALTTIRRPPAAPRNWRAEWGWWCRRDEDDGAEREPSQRRDRARGLPV